MILLGTIGAIIVHRDGRDNRLVAALFSVSALALLVGAVMTTVFHFRYAIPVLPLVGPAAAIGVDALWRGMRSPASEN